MSETKLKDSYKLLGLTQNATIEELKGKFKKLAIQYHPDKGGSEYLFGLISKSFKLVYKHIKSLDEKDFNSLKAESRGMNSGESVIKITSDEGFINKFNKTFEKNRLHDPVVDTGYEGFMNEDKVHVQKSSHKVVKYVTPEPILLCNSLSFVELGVGQVNDYSGKNDDSKKLQYMDYKKAHTTSKLIHEDEVKERHSYSSLEDLQKKRTSENFDMTDEEKYYEELITNKEKRIEDTREQTLRKQDSEWAIHHQKMSQLFIK
tara:strand:- start:702 stop:1484 length:783 start_codon:yes stop_codon:yes gene_type:complete